MKLILSYLILVFALSSCVNKQPYPVVGMVQHRIKAGEQLADIARRYQVKIDAIRKENNIYDPEDQAEGMILFIPGGKATTENMRRQPPEPELSVPDFGRGQSLFIWPAKGTLSSGYGKRWGRMHYGLDITKDGGKEISAAATGIVEYAGWRGGYGKTVVINHGQGYKTLYAHNAKLYVKTGQRVKAGQQISLMGTSGRSTGIHLHFEIKKNGIHQNPLRYLPPR